MKKALFAGLLAVAAIGGLMVMTGEAAAHPVVIVGGPVRPVYHVHRPVVVSYGHTHLYSSSYCLPSYPLYPIHDPCYPRVIYTTPRVITTVHSPFCGW